MDFGLHLPLMEFRGEGISRRRLTDAVDAARECGFTTVSANDHFLFSTPWLDGPTALAAVASRSGKMTLGTTLSLVVLRGPVPLAKTLAALDIVCGGRLVAGLGPGSSERDYEALGVPFEERWKRLDEAVEMVRTLLRGELPRSGGFYPAPATPLRPSPERSAGIPLWLGSWGSDAGMRRVARLGDGWLASAYNTTPQRFAAARELLERELRERDRAAEGFPNALVTMWTWVTDDEKEADRVLSETLGPLLRRDPGELAEQLCIGSPDHCARLLSRYARAGCARVHFWPLGEERRQVELLAGEVLPRVAATRARYPPG
jgi:alkanesulfonate monooxygenase SsuD/methylene tetrahydromethanopterin reductase-like flavin-dependent oxidoreductase (luciferase family)